MTLVVVCVFALTVLAIVLGLVFVLIVHQRQRREIEALRAQLQVFVDTSINVARCVDSLVVQRGALGTQSSAADSKPPQHRAVASRRWLLAEARQRLDAGTSLEELALTLGLHKDELKILSLVS